MELKKSAAEIVTLSFLLIMWWRAVWSLLDLAFERLAKGKKYLLITFDVASIVFVLAVLFFHPDARETFS